MNSPSQQAGKLSTRELCILALMGALIFASKVALASLPNININSVLIILTVIFFGWRSLYAVYLYVMLEGLVFGFSVWWVGYLYVWAILVVVAMLLRRNDSAVIWAVVAAIYGLVFGLLMYLEYFAINGGWEMFFAMWVAGIPYDLTHCIGNFVFTLVLYKPLYRVLAYFLGPPKFT
ncbi:MAG: hypothetical protein IJQ02_06475 [Oscillospiraceae bacterium]|nr:hypothetical protein [Oscillospiraceae bacterium]